MKKRNAVPLLILLLMGSSVPASEIVVSLAATRDTTLFESPDGALSNGAGDFLFVGTTGQTTNNVRRSLVAFDALDVPEDATLVTAELSLFVSKVASSNEISLGLHRLVADWDEGSADASGGEGGGAAAVTGDATWLHASFDTALWNRPGGDFLASPSTEISVGGSGRYTWGGDGSLVDDVNYWLSNPSENFGWAIVGGEDTDQSAKRFDSRLIDVASRRPELLLTFVPEPTVTIGMVWLITLPFLFRKLR